jgi:hypothetical protein
MDNTAIFLTSSYTIFLRPILTLFSFYVYVTRVSSPIDTFEIENNTHAIIISAIKLNTTLNFQVNTRKKFYSCEV